MPTLPQDCVNYQINIQMCPCESEECERRGICCECVQAHYEAGKPNACMGGAERKPETLSLSTEAAARCLLNQERNLEFCLCTYEPCDNKGVCCNCVRNHFSVDGAGRVACMKAM